MDKNPRSASDRKKINIIQSFNGKADEFLFVLGDFSDFPSIHFEKININLKIIIFIQVFTFPHSLTKYWRTLPPGTGCCRSPHNADMDPHH